MSEIFEQFLPKIGIETKVSSIFVKFTWFVALFFESYLNLVLPRLIDTMPSNSNFKKGYLKFFLNNYN